MKEAEGVLTKEQFAKFKAECRGTGKSKTGNIILPRLLV